VAQLENNLAATKVILSPEQIERLYEVSAIPSVFPYTVLNAPRTDRASPAASLSSSTRRRKPLPEWPKSRHVSDGHVQIPDALLTRWHAAGVCDEGQGVRLR
jgi:hypothetical protein